MPLLDKSQLKWMLCTSTLSGLELMFCSQKYLLSLKKLSSLYLPIAGEATQHSPSLLGFKNKAMADPFYIEKNVLHARLGLAAEK